MPPAGFELAIPRSERPHTHALNRSATGIGCFNLTENYLPGTEQLRFGFTLPLILVIKYTAHNCGYKVATEHTRACLNVDY
jgi:hypothetical protein